MRSILPLVWMRTFSPPWISGATARNDLERFAGAEGAAMPDEPAPSPALLSALCLTADDLAPTFGRSLALSLEEQADLWLAWMADDNGDVLEAELLRGVETAAASLLTCRRPLLFVVGVGRDGRPAFRLVPAAVAPALMMMAAFLAHGMPYHDVVTFDGQPRPEPCVALALDPCAVSRRRRPSVDELRHYVASRLLMRLGDVKRLLGG